jgi:cyclopropane-fatty-acyl-phospholipid synthase
MIGQKHYDLGNDLLQNMLDKGMICAYWKDAESLNSAQENKLGLIGWRKL